MSNYDENPIIANLRKAYWSPDEDAGQIWETFKQGFARMSPAERRQSLLTADTYLAEQIRPTREHAALVQQKRELDDLHLMLHRAGR